MPSPDSLTSTIQQKIDSVMSHVVLGVVLIFGFLLLSSLLKLLFGKKAQIGKAITSGMEILCLYVIYIAIYAFHLHWDLFLHPLPFISLDNNTLHIFSFAGADFTTICGEILQLLILAFLVNLMNSVIPTGKHFLTWLLLRSGTILLAIFVNYMAAYVLDLWLPFEIAAYAPIILMCVLVLLILMGSLKLLVGLALGVANPIIGALYTFFFANFIGRALARAILTTALITVLVYLANILKLTSVVIATSA